MTVLFWAVIPVYIPLLKTIKHILIITAFLRLLNQLNN